MSFHLANRKELYQAVEKERFLKVEWEWKKEIIGKECLVSDKVAFLKGTKGPTGLITSLGLTRFKTDWLKLHSWMWKPRVFPDDARECQCPFVLFLHSQGGLREVSGHRVLLNCGPGNQGRSTWGTSHGACLEFPREAGLILRGAGKAGNPFQTTQGNQLSCREQERSRSSEEVVPGLSVFPSRERGMSGKFWMSLEIL